MPRGRIPRHFIETLLARVDVVDVVRARIPLRRAGQEHVACCPFHDEKTPSFSVSQSKQFYHCFGCGANGDAIGFLMAYENMHFVDAIEALAESVGLAVPCDEQAATARDEARPLYETLEKAALFYRQSLRSAPAAIDYLKSRGLDGKTAKRFGIGYAPEGADELQRTMPAETKRLLATGLLIARQDDGPPLARFSDRVMFPIHDRRGRVIAFAGRTLGDAVPKWMNAPETVLFRESRGLHGLHEAQRAAAEEGAMIMARRCMDVVVLAHHGVGNAVAPVGTRVTREHIETIYRIVPNIVFCIGEDRDAQVAAADALEAILPAISDGRDVHFLALLGGETLESLVHTTGGEGFRERLATKRLTLVDLLYRHLTREIGDVEENERAARLDERAKALVALMPNGLYRRLVTRQLESLLGMGLER